MSEPPAPSSSVTKRVALRSAKNPWTVVSAESNLRENLFGNNVGNLVFSTAAHRTLMTSRVDVEAVGLKVPKDSAKINAEYDAFVVPLANAFRRGFKDSLDRLSTFIEQLTIPVIVVGVGAQAALGHDLSALAPMDDAVKRFVATVLDHSATIGVRGEFTMEYLNSLGFSDVEVIGCPSMFTYGPELPLRPKVAEVTKSSKLSIGVSPYVEAMGPIVKRHVKLYPRLTYVPQDIETLSKMLRGEAAEDIDKESDIPIYLSHPLFKRDKVRFFVDPSTWVDHLSERDLYFGTRIHGTIVSLLAGTPAVLLAHDSRTLELARYHDIPYRMINSLPKGVVAEQLNDEADFTALVSGQRKRFDTYVAFLERNGLDHVWKPGESTAEFDRRVAAARFPPGVKMSNASRGSRITGRARLGALKSKLRRG